MSRHNVNHRPPVWKLCRVLSSPFGLVCLLAATAAPAQVQTSALDFETEALDLETGHLVEPGNPLADSNTAEELAPASLSREAWGAITRSIERDLYGARPAEKGAPDQRVLEAANPAQAYSTRFTSQGILVRPRGADFEVGLTLSAWGYKGALNSAPLAPPRAEGQRVTYVRGPLEEWYVNRASGLEHGFTLTAPPQGAPGQLRLELVLSGPLVAEARDRAVLLRDGEGRIRLRYAGLKAWDATGRKLPARMTMAETNLALEIDDAQAIYPVTIDPVLLNENAKLLAGDGAAADAFGEVAVSRDTVVVGAVGHDPLGSAYVFERPADGWDGTLLHTAKLLPGENVWHFGRSVAISGDIVVVGQHLEPPGSTRGSAWVFERPAGGWAGTLTPTAKLLPGDGEPGDGFGISVAVSCDTVVVGAPRDSDLVADAGSAYVFMRPAGGWDGTLSHDAKLIAGDGAEGDSFGFSVAVSDDTVVVGAFGKDDAGIASGSAYVFERPAGGWDGTLSHNAKLLAGDGAPQYHFGVSVAISANTVVVGADHGGSLSGSAYVFERPVGGWAGTLLHTAKLLAGDGAAWDSFGSSVAVSLYTVVVGAPRDSDLVADAGSAYLFRRPAGGWAGTLLHTAKLLASDGATGDSFGKVAVSRDTVVVGAKWDDDKGPESGSVYVFWLADADGDVVPDDSDNCPTTPNASQLDSDGDGRGDACDPCPLDPNDDADGDGRCANIDPCPLDPDDDIDGDGFCANLDNCPAKPNASQVDSDGDGRGDACDPVVEVSVGMDHTCVRRISGHVYCWGGNSRGQLGNGTTTGNLTPVPVQVLTKTTWLSAGSSYTCAVEQQRVFCWGLNFAGQLGDGTTTNRKAPVKVHVGEPAVQVSAGLGGHTCAVSDAGAVFCWGANSEGQLGDGWTNSSTTPVRVHGYGRYEIDARGGADQVSVGEVHSCVTRDGAVECWGSNGSGQIRPGSPEEGVFLTPVAVHEADRDVSAGIEDTCAVGRSGVVCWGALFSFQNDQFGFEPIVGVDAKISAIGDGFNCGIVSGDQVACWDDSLTATLVPGLSGVTEVSAGPSHACALRNDGEVFCWGANAKGQLGDGTTNPSSVPVQVVGLYN